MGDIQQCFKSPPAAASVLIFTNVLSTPGTTGHSKGTKWGWMIFFLPLACFLDFLDHHYHGQKCSSLLFGVLAVLVLQPRLSVPLSRLLPSQTSLLLLLDPDLPALVIQSQGGGHALPMNKLGRSDNVLLLNGRIRGSWCHNGDCCLQTSLPE